MVAALPHYEDEAGLLEKEKNKYNAQCANNPEHIFEYVYTIEIGSEDIKSDVQAFCPYCDGFVDITIKGKVVPDTILRRFED